MFLSDKTIKKYLASGKIIISPKVKTSDIRQVGIRVHLDARILIPEQDQLIDLGNPGEIKYKELSLEREEFLFKPGDFILASTMEKIQMDPSLIAFIDGRSTIARLGLTVHVSSVTTDGKYEQPGVVTLEMKNLGNHIIKLVSNYPVGMLTFSTLTENIEQADQIRYKGQSVATAPDLKFKL